MLSSVSHVGTVGLHPLAGTRCTRFSVGGWMLGMLQRLNGESSSIFSA
jgi:hypothetical protein